ncbi:MAG: hypothetical protein Kow0099_26620 [Candidatus Abyssubacteria bacterium]
MLWGVPVNFWERQITKGKDVILNRFREKEYNLKDDILLDFYDRLRREKPDYLMGYSSMVYEFARYLQQKNLDGTCLGLRMVKCTSETIHEIYREIIENTFGCKLVSEYGAAETGLIAFECPEGSHHLMNDCVYVQFVDCDILVNGQPAKRILVTDLHNYAVPVINYDVGDLVLPSDNTCCPCGRPFPMVERIFGRLGNVVVTPDGQRLHSIIFYYIMKGLAEKGGGVRSFKVYQKAQDRLSVLLVKDSHFTENTLQFLMKEFERHFGPEMQVNFEFCESIPREKSGKLRDFVQEIDVGTG